MSWHLLEKILDEVSKQSTLVGKVWITLLFVFRIIAITRIGDTIYADEQAAFKCNTRQPGCENVCFNEFSPISHVRFWGFQTIIVATPPIIFIIYAAHIVGKLGHYKLTGRRVELDKRKKKDGLNIKSQPTPIAENTKQVSNETILSKNKFARPEIEKLNKKFAHPEIEQRLISDDVEPNVIFKSNNQHQTHEPPPYNETRKYCEEIELISPTLYYNPHNTEKISSSRSRSFKQLSRFCRQVSLENIHRRYSYDISSDHTISPTTNSMSTNDLPWQRSDATPRKYTVAKEYILNEIVTPSHANISDFVGNNKCSKRSDKDSAFSENGSTANSFSNLYETVHMKTSNPLNYDLNHKAAPVKNFSRGIAFSTPERYNNFGLNFTQSSDLPHPNKHTMKQNQLTPISIKKRRTYAKGYSGSSSIFKSPKIQAFVKRMENRIGIAYFMQCFFRILLELCFLVLQYYLFHFDVPELYRCDKWPCPNTVDCFVSRPREKETMLMFMFGISLLCIILSCYEIFLLTYHRANDLYKKRKLRKELRTVVIYDKEGTSKVIKGNVNDKIFQEEANKRLLQTMLYDVSSSSSASTSSSENSEHEENDEQASFNSEELSDMFENEIEDIGDFNDLGNEQENEITQPQ